MSEEPSSRYIVMLEAVPGSKPQSAFIELDFAPRLEEKHGYLCAINTLPTWLLQRLAVFNVAVVHPSDDLEGVGMVYGVSYFGDGHHNNSDNCGIYLTRTEAKALRRWLKIHARVVSLDDVHALSKWWEKHG